MCEGAAESKLVRDVPHPLTVFTFACVRVLQFSGGGIICKAAAESTLVCVVPHPLIVCTHMCMCACCALFGGGNEIGKQLPSRH